jgi:acyl-CoA thioesterase FadM
MNENERPPKLLVRAPVTVRWGDMDAYNHVNNSVYATYVEEARIRWFSTLHPNWKSNEAAPILAALNMNFRRPISGQRNSSSTCWPVASVAVRSTRSSASSIATIRNGCMPKATA